MNNEVVALSPEDESQPLELTVDDAYDMAGGHGRYQFLVAISVSIAVFTNLFYLFFIPLFLIHPEVLDINGNPFNSKDEACKASYRRYKERYFNFITEYDLLCDDMKASIISSVFQFGYILASLTISNVTDHVGRLPLFYVEQLGITVSLKIGRASCRVRVSSQC